MTATEGTGVVNGAALASYLAAAIGAFAMGVVVILSEAGLFSAPALYAPAGGLSGRTTLAIVIWLGAWAGLHSRWKNRQIDSGRVRLLGIALILLGVLLTFPPVWGLF